MLVVVIIVVVWGRVLSRRFIYVNEEYSLG